jgi:hypothetical protein
VYDKIESRFELLSPKPLDYDDGRPLLPLRLPEPAAKEVVAAGRVQDPSVGGPNCGLYEEDGDEEETLFGGKQELGWKDIEEGLQPNMMMDA